MFFNIGLYVLDKKGIPFRFMKSKAGYKINKF